MLVVPDLRHRHQQPEIMDQPGLAPQAHEQALRDLARINLLSNSAGILWPSIRDLFRRSNRPLRLLDVATGGGDVPLRLGRMARRAGLSLHIEACDRSPEALRLAQRQAEHSEVPVRFFAWDALTDPLPGRYDLVTTSLFLHHLDEHEARGLLQRMSEMAGQMLLVNDLERGLLGWLLAWLGTRILSRSSVVHFDGPISVEGAFTCAEARALARQAGLTRAEVHRCWPCRFLLRWRRV